MQNIYDVIILGSGPSGLTAAIYTARASIKTLILGGNPPGGQLTTTTEVENFPGFPEGIMGPELISNMRKQAERFGTEFKDVNAQKIEGNAEKGFIVTDENNQTYTAKSIIIATGATAKWLGLPSEESFKGRGVSACATCDGFFFKDKVIAVVGGGDAAMEEANYLTKFASRVYVLARGKKEDLKASKIMQDRALANEKIEFIFNTEVLDLLGEAKLETLQITNNQTQEQTDLPVDGLFVAIGHKPSTGFLEDFVELDKMGYVKVTDNTLTSVKGVFVAGDVQDYKYRQAISAAGLGCMAALDVEKYLAH